MKILHVFPFFSLKHFGGTVDLMYKIARAQALRGHEVTIYTGNYKFDQEYADSLEGVKVVAFKSWLNFGFYLMPSMVKEVKKNLRDFDIVHMHVYRSYQNVVIRRYAKKYGVPYIMDSHGSIHRFSKIGKMWLFDIIFGSKILRDASIHLAETEVGAKGYRKAGVASDKVVILSPPFPVEDFAQLPPPGNFRRKFNVKEKHIVLFLGRINWIKGLDFLVESFHELAQRRNNVILVIVGSDDGYLATLEDLIGKLSLSDKVLFTGFVSTEDKLAALVDADVMVQTSRYEEGAWAPFEAILCNTPIIVSSNSGAGEDVKKIDAGYLVEWGNKKELSDTIQKVLYNSTEAISKTQKAKDYIEANLSMSKRIVEYEELYSKCIEENKLVVGRKNEDTDIAFL